MAGVSVSVRWARRATFVGLAALLGAWAGWSACAGSGPQPALTAAEQERGLALYTQYCARCHGVTGSGDGPDAIGLQPPPLNFSVHVPYHGDPQLFRFIADGVAGTAMPVWRSTLSEDQIWALVHYLRATFKEEQQ